MTPATGDRDAEASGAGASAAEIAESTPASSSGGRLGSFGWPLLVSALTFVYALVPPVVGVQGFYRRGDSASQFIPTWYHLGELLRSGTWPPLLDPNSWHGGNYPAEALFGIYNPLNALNWLFVSYQSNLDVAATFVKAEFLTILALGVYLLCREYGAAPWAASIVAVAMPFAGFTLYWDAASWASGLSAFMYMPHVWWSFRKVSRGRLNPFWGFLIGALAITQGNPYGVLGVVVVGAGLGVELMVQRHWAGLRRLLLIGACTATLLPLVFMPLLATAPLAHRADLAKVSNNGFMRPNIGDLFNLSAPSYLPGILTFTDPMQVPAAYFAWFLLPLLPWLRWSTLRGRIASITGILTVATLYLLLTTAPSTLWLFRWPLRLVEYLELSLAVVFAIVLSAGLVRDRLRMRLAASLALVLAGGYLSWAQRPGTLPTHLLATVLVAVLVAALVWVIWTRLNRLAAVAVAQVGTLLVLLFQINAIPENLSSGNWDFPASVPVLQERYASYTGTTIQFADINIVRDHADKRGSSVWGGLAAGSLYHVAGVDSINTYSGVGLQDFTKRLCMDFKGDTRPCGYQHLFAATGRERPSLAELLKVQTVVVQQGFLPKLVVPPGWQVAKRTSQVVVLQPKAAWPYPNSRLSWASAGVQVKSAHTVSATSDLVDVTTTPGHPHTLVFARLGWPGYAAELDGHALAVSRTGAGLLEVHLPAGATSGQVSITFTPPGQHVGLALAGLGVLAAAALGVIGVLRRRRDDEHEQQMPTRAQPDQLE